MRDLLAPYITNAIPNAVYEQLDVYLDLLLRWNGRTNLTAIRDRNGIIQRQFGESLFLAQHLPPFQTFLDFGSGAGFPGIPVQLLHPEAKVTLAESQGKKASFLREAVRVLALPSTVWAQRVEAMPEQTFDIVTLRAVDNMAEAMRVARPRVSPGGFFAVFTSANDDSLPQDFHWTTCDLPNSTGKVHIGAEASK